MLLLPMPVLARKLHAQHVISRVRDNNFQARLLLNVATNRRGRIFACGDVGKKVEEAHSGMCVRDETRRP